MKKLVALALALGMCFSMFACGSKEQSNTNTGSESGTNTSGETATQGGTPIATGTDVLSVCLASEPDSIDPALNSTVDGATMVAHLFSGLAKWAQNDDGTLSIQPDAVTELVEGVVNEDGTITYTYTLRDGLTWSDGQPVTAGDFVFAWNRAADPATGASYGYMFDVIDGYAAMSELDANGNIVNPDATLNVQAPDEKTLVVTLSTPVAYWNELLAFPTYYPVREDVVANEAWATDPSTYVSNGPYTLTGWEHDSLITLTKNENYVDADTILMPQIDFYLSDDANNMLTNFQNGSWLLIDDVPSNEIPNLSASYPDEYFVAGQIGTYYACWNINQDLLPADSGLTGVEAEAAQAEIRNAISLLLDRNYIVESVAQGGQVPASSFVAMGITNPDGSEFYETAGGNDFPGYFDVSADAYTDNWNTALETLKKYYDFDESTQKFTNFPSITYLYNSGDAHKAIGEYMAGVLNGIGITMNLENQEWGTFVNTRKQGDYTMARNGWLADYNDPISFLDMWISTSGNNDVQFGKGDHAGVAAYSLDLTPFGIDYKVENATWAETYDVLISEIKACSDLEIRNEMMHLAEDMVMASGCIVPLYFYTDIYMLNSHVDGFFSNPLGYKYFMYTTIEG